jgi:ABC-type nitrate/sulfonate/bicarbonate transport system permease component
MLSKRTARLFSIAAPVAALILWEIVVRLGILDVRFFTPPTQILNTLIRMSESGELMQHAGASLSRLVGGFAIGTLLGIIFGVICGWFSLARAVFVPLINILYPVPKIALLPLMLVIFGLGENSKIATIAIAVFFPMFITTVTGVSQIDPILIQAAQNFGARGIRLFVYVIVPAALPSIFTGLRLSVGVALLTLVAAEFSATDNGLAHLIWRSWETLAVNRMYAALVVIVSIGLMASALVELLKRVILPWMTDVQQRTR